jgi:hypothetical protein
VREDIDIEMETWDDLRIYEPICKEWSFFTTGWVYLFTNQNSLLIVLINFVYRYLFLYLADFVGFRSQASKGNWIKNTIFFSNFFNLGLVVTMASCNSRNFHAVSNLFDGIYSDFNANWFSDVGYIIIYNMLYNSAWPIIEFFLFYLFRHVARAVDQRSFWPNDIYKTHCVTISDFASLYSGPEFLAHYKYSNILKIVMITFLYGPIMPILFPIAFISIGI